MRIEPTLLADMPPSVQLDYVTQRLERLAEMTTGREFEPFLKYQADPVAYARDILGITWWSQQVEIAEAVRDKRRIAVYAGHAVGKTHMLGGLVQWHFDCFRPSITLTTAPSWPSIHDLLWGEVKAQRRQGAPGRMLDMELRGMSMHYVKGHNAQTATGFQGRHEARMLIVLDEAMGVPTYIWEASNAMMVADDCKTLATGNPTETSGPYYEISHNPDWVTIRISCLEHPNIAADLAGKPPPFPKAVRLTWVREMLRDHATHTTNPDADSIEFPKGSGEWYAPDDVFRSRVLGLFPRQAANSIFGEAWIDEARKNTLDYEPEDLFEVGVDVARFGHDLTTIYGRKGGVVLGREAHQKKDTMETVGQVVLHVERWAVELGLEPKETVTINVDDTGLGGGVTDRLRELGWNVNPVIFGSSAIEADNYYNRVAELWFTAANMMRQRKIDLSRLAPDVAQKLSAELRARTFRTKSDRKLQIESKDELKKRIGHSPDDADGFVLAFAGGARVSRKTMHEISQADPSRFGIRNQDAGGGRWDRLRSNSRFRR